MDPSCLVTTVVVV